MTKIKKTIAPRIEVRMPENPKRVERARKALKEEARRNGMRLSPHVLAILEAHIAQQQATAP